MTNLDRLKALMDEHHLSRQRVADLIGCKIQAVHSWHFAPETRGYRQPSNQIIELLELKLKQEE